MREAIVQLMIAECLGTFILVSVILSTGEAIPIGIALAVAILVGSFASGAHFNPAVTLVMAMKGTIRPQAAPLYLLGQIAGAVAALWWYASTKNKLPVHR